MAHLSKQGHIPSLSKQDRIFHLSKLGKAAYMPGQGKISYRNLKNSLKNPSFIILLFLTTVGLFLRLYLAFREGIWWDEWSCVEYSRMSFLRFIRHFLTNESHPPLFFLLQDLMIESFGEKLIIIRFLPVIFGTLSIPLTYILAFSLTKDNLIGQKKFIIRLLFPEKTAYMPLLAAFILAVNPMHMAWSANGRMYSMLGFFALLSTIYLIDFQKSLWNKPGFYVFFLLLAVYTHYYAAFIAAGHLFWVIHLFFFGKIGKKALINFLKAYGMVIFFFFPWLISSNLLPFNKNFSSCITSWLPATGVEDLVRSLSQIFFDFDLCFIPWIYFVILAIYSIFVFPKKEREYHTLILYLFLSIIFLFYTFGNLTQVFLGSSIYQHFQVVYGAPFLSIVLSFILKPGKSRIIPYCICFFLILLSLISTYPKKRVKLEQIKEYYSNIATDKSRLFISPVKKNEIFRFYQGIKSLPVYFDFPEDKRYYGPFFQQLFAPYDDLCLAYRLMPFSYEKICRIDLSCLEWLRENWSFIDEKVIHKDMQWRLFHFRRKSLNQGKISDSLIDNRDYIPSNSEDDNPATIQEKDGRLKVKCGPFFIPSFVNLQGKLKHYGKLSTKFQPQDFLGDIELKREGNYLTGFINKDMIGKNRYFLCETNISFLLFQAYSGGSIFNLSIHDIKGLSRDNEVIINYDRGRPEAVIIKAISQWAVLVLLLLNCFFFLSKGRKERRNKQNTAELP